MSRPTKGQTALIAAAFAVLSSPYWGPRIISLANIEPKEFATQKDLEADRRVGAEVVKRIDVQLQSLDDDATYIRRRVDEILDRIAPRHTDAGFDWEKIATEKSP